MHSQLAFAEGALHRRIVSWPSRGVRALGPSVASSRTPTKAIELFRVGDALIRLELCGGVLTATIAARGREQLDEIELLLRGELPQVDRDDAQDVPVSFWTRATDGAYRVTRRIAVPTWPGVAANYAPTAARAIAALVAARDGLEGGQLMLWHGAAGTGKTHALRALAWEWRDWCDVHYIVDPDKLLGEHPDYLVELLLMEDDADWEDDDDGRSRWRLLVLEDCGELVSADARAQAGQGLSRLLNTVDGLIGQGLRILVLITTNEQVGRLHAALSRPGRCAAVVEFPCLTREQAARWLTERGHAGGRVEAASVAELYAALAGREGRRGGQAPGFAIA